MVSGITAEDRLMYGRSEGQQRSETDKRNRKNIDIIMLSLIIHFKIYRIRSCHFGPLRTFYF